MIEKRRLANEGRAIHYSAESMQRKDRCLFVENLGWLLRQTREGITNMRLPLRKEDTETVTIHYRDGGTEEINISGDSYMAIFKDVAKHL